MKKQSAKKKVECFWVTIYTTKKVSNLFAWIDALLLELMLINLQITHIGHAESTREKNWTMFQKTKQIHVIGNSVYRFREITYCWKRKRGKAKRRGTKREKEERAGTRANEWERESVWKKNRDMAVIITKSIEIDTVWTFLLPLINGRIELLLFLISHHNIYGAISVDFACVFFLILSTIV